MAKTYILLNNNPKAKQCLNNINYRTSSKTKDQAFMFGVAYQDINYWLNYYDVQRKYSFALKDYEKAYRYSDSLYTIKYKVDSLFNGFEVQAAQNRIDTKEKQYENDKKEAVIQNKDKQMILIISLLGVIIIASILLFLQNRKIKNRNKIINQQLKELSKTLEQKQVLLSELQHRVKNNLQHVISILEIQKESVDFNNIDELIRGNQNRIHSMALLHKKLNVSENVNEVDLKRYITELAELVKDSYDNHKKKIQLIIQCKIEEISIEKALPIGLIIVELVSNSMKHAFRNQNTGIIFIEIKKDEKHRRKNCIIRITEEDLILTKPMKKA
jgi:two-component system, sensor histidine kinase PdtaS